MNVSDIFCSDLGCLSRQLACLSVRSLRCLCQKNTEFSFGFFASLLSFVKVAVKKGIVNGADLLGVYSDVDDDITGVGLDSSLTRPMKSLIHLQSNG